jgi:hypothetical protein
MVLALEPFDKVLPELGDLGLDHHAAIGIPPANAREVLLVVFLGQWNCDAGATWVTIGERKSFSAVSFAITSRPPASARREW